MEYVNNLSPGPLGGNQADQKLAASWVDKLAQWDGGWGRLQPCGVHFLAVNHTAAQHP